MRQIFRYPLVCVVLIAAACGRNVPVEQYIQDLKSTDQHKRNQAALGLIKAKDKAIGPLAAVLKQDDEVEKLAALQILAKINTLKASQAALAALGDHSLDVRLAAAAMLAAGPQIADACSLYINAAHDPFWKVRMEMAKALARYNSQKAIAALADMLSDEEPDVRAIVVQNLLSMQPEFVGEALLARIDAPDEQVRYIIVQAMGSLGEQRAIPQLLKILKEDKNTNLRQKAAMSLAQLRCREAVPLLKDMYAKGNLDEKKAAKDAMTALGLMDFQP